MGQALCPIFRNREVKVLYIGLDAAGKTTLLYKLKLGEIVTTIPTIGFNVESLTHNGVTMVTWDVSSRDKARALWRHYFAMLDGLVFVVDSTDKERLGEAANELIRVIQEIQDRELPVLVLANKQDQEQVLSPGEIRKAIDSKGGKFRIPLEVFPTSAITDEGVTEALDWLTSQMTSKAMEKSVLHPVTKALYDTVQYPASALKSSFKTLSGIFWASKPAEESTEESER